MIYVMSDIHGCYTEFQEMLEKINFSSSDTLYVLGDCVDRGKEPIKVLLDCLLTDNIKLLCGNHEWFLFECADYLKPWSNNTLSEYMNNLYTCNWMLNGGDVTARKFMELSYEDRKFILNSIKELPLYFELDVNGESYVLIHGGFGDSFNVNKKLSKYKRQTLIWERLEPKEFYYPDKHIIVGHTPTPGLSLHRKSKILSCHNNYWIDCGCVFGYKLACLCLDTLEEYYVYSDMYSDIFKSK